MHAILHVVGSIFSVPNTLSSALAAQIVRFLDRPLGAFVIADASVTSLALAILCAAWAVAERALFARSRERMQTALHQAELARQFRDAILDRVPEAVVVLRTTTQRPLCYHGGAKLLQYCLEGPDATQLAAAIENLLTRALSFSISVRTRSLRQISLRGLPIADGAVLFLRAGDHARMEPPRSKAEKQHGVAVAREPQGRTVETSHEGIIVIGTDGRLKSCNSVFAQQWRLTENELGGEPFFAEVIASCIARNGYDPIWSVVSNAIMCAEPERFNDWRTTTDGSPHALTIQRLPDGARLVTFARAAQDDSKKLPIAARAA